MFTTLSSSLSLILSQMLYQAPLLLLYLIGMICGFIFYRRYPRPATLVIAGCTILFIGGLGGTLANIWLIQMRMESDLSMTQMGIYFSALGIVRLIFSIVGQILLLIAAFSGRTSSDRS